MNMLVETPQKTLEECIAIAISKLKVQNENDLCRYLPGQNGHLHHFTFDKLKKTSPTELQMMIEMHILAKEPELIHAKPRVKKTSNKGPEIKFKQSQLSRLIDILKKEGEEELISIFSPHLKLSHIQKQLIESVRSKSIDEELWATYMTLVKEEQSPSSTS